MKMQDNMQDKLKEYAASLRSFLAEKFADLSAWLKDYFGTMWQIFALPQLAKAKWQQLKAWRIKETPRRKLAFAAVLLLMLVLSFSLQLYGNSLIGKLQTQQAAERWRGTSEQAFAQTTMYLPIGSEWTEGDVRSARQQMDKNLVDTGISAEEGQQLWIDAYASNAGKLKVRGEYGEAETQAITVGGDWFFFHPLQLRSGTYISGDELMKDRIVINELLAWRLFGAIDVAGMEATIGGNTYYVAGVVKTESDKATKMVHNDGPMMFMLYGAANGDENIAVYELVSPEPFTSYAFYFLKSYTEDGGEVINNSRRFNTGRLLTQLIHPAERVISNSGVAFPYWENAARVVEVWAMLLLQWRLILLVLPAATLAYGLWRGFRAARSYCKLKWQEFSLTR